MQQPRENFDEKNVEEDQIDFDVVIVGAGLSGLTAANRLLSAGLSVQILEKANYAGGRLLSKKDSESYYAHELQSRLNEMIRRLKLSKVREIIENDRKVLHLRNNNILNELLPFYASGEVYSFIKMINSMSKKITHAHCAAEKMNEKLSNVSVEDILCHLVTFKKSREICRNLIFVTCGITNLKEMSALWYLIMLSGAGGFIQRLRVNLGDSNRFYVKGGLMNIAQLLTENVEKTNPIRYSETVYKIQFNDDRAHVWTNKNAHFKCQYIVVAVPPLESSEIVIEPRLPMNVRKAQSSFEEGKNVFFNGICLRYQGRDSSVKCLIDAESKESNLRLAYDATCHEAQLRISGFLSNTTADAVAGNDVVAILNECFKASISSFDEYTETDWRNVPTGSPMNVLRPGSFRTHFNFLSHAHGRVFFAASEYAKRWPGTVDGAIEAGESSACSVLAIIRPQSMKRFEWILYKSKSLAINIEEPNVGLIVAHNICFWFNLYISLSFLRTAILSLQSWY